MTATTLPPPPLPPNHSVRLAVVGAGPVGLTLALLAARRWPAADITVFDARSADKDVSADPRTLALSLGSVQLLQRLDVWPAAAAQPILQVHVSQAPPTLGGRHLVPEVRLSAQDEGVPQLGAVLAYGQIVAPLQAAWQAVCAAQPQRCQMRFGTPVAALKDLEGSGGGVEIDAGIAERFDLAVIAEGGVFAEQARKAVTHDYRQTAWVGPVTLDATAAPGSAFERFTRHGPVALLPLPARPGDAAGTRRASLVWCVPADDDPVAELNDAQRLAVLQTLLPEAAGRLLSVAPLKHFPLGLNAERTLVAGRQVRIGNAAQTLHPVAGQGLNLGLRDAYALVETLQSARDIDSALRRIEWARAPDRWSMIAATDFLARSFTWQWPGLAAVRGLGLAALQALPPVKSALGAADDVRAALRAGGQQGRGAPLRRRQAVQAMPAQHMALGHAGVVEVLLRVVHADALHHRAGAGVGQRGERDDLGQVEALESGREHGARRLAGQPLAPVGMRQAPARSRCRANRASVRRGFGEPDKADEVAGVAVLDRPVC